MLNHKDKSDLSPHDSESIATVPNYDTEAGLRVGFSFMEGWVKLHRKFIEWEWFQNSNAVHLFITFFLLANHKDNTWQGEVIKRGQFITSIQKLSIMTGISQQSVRTILKKFQNTNEISVKSTSRFTMITICKYDSYQAEKNEANKPLTNNQQTTNKQLTTNKNDKKDNNEKNKKGFDFSKFNEYETELLKSWNDYRIEIKKPITQIAINLFRKQFDEYGFSEVKKALEKAMVNGSQGFTFNLPEKKAFTPKF